MPSWYDIHQLLGIEHGDRGEDEHAPPEELEERIAAVGPAVLADREVFFAILMSNSGLAESTLVSILNCMDGAMLGSTVRLCMRHICKLKERTPVAVVERLLDAIPEEDTRLVTVTILGAARSSCPAVIAMLERKLPPSAWAGELGGSDPVSENISEFFPTVRGTEEADDEILAALLRLCPRSFATKKRASAPFTNAPTSTALYTALALTNRRAADILLSFFTPAEIFDGFHEGDDLLPAAAGGGNVARLRRLVTLFDEYKKENAAVASVPMEGIVQNMYKRAAFARSLDTLVFLRETYGDKHVNNAVIFEMARGLVQQSSREAVRWLFETYPAIFSIQEGDCRFLCLVASSPPDIVEEATTALLKLPREQLVDMLLFLDDSSSPPQQSGDTTKEPEPVQTLPAGDINMFAVFQGYNVYAERSPPGPLFKAIAGGAFMGFIPLLRAVPEALHVHLATKNLLHIAALVKKPPVLEWLAATVPRELATARDKDGKTALDYAKEGGMQLSPDAVLALSFATKRAE